ncbi:MAG: aminotransferase class I/II-fold pyridoxal phosphate-dependent enzyme [Spirochaetia bacterium]|nr:aminotransferase class I/II-fold pyridoxal phosphate-dependent enzyme [Spirochaetia bacterium]
MENKKHKFATKCVHAGEELDLQGGIHIPLYNHSTFGFKTTRDLLDVVEGKKEGNLYTRYGLNPTIKAVEKKIAALEEGEAALAFSSGMAAEAALFLSQCKQGDHIICIGDVYGGTYELLESNLPSAGITTSFLLGNEINNLSNIIKPNTKIIFFETPTNPNLEVLDIQKITTIAKSKNILTAVDNTFASPVNQNPLLLSADIVIHSATKYLGGHSDLTGGFIIASKDIIESIWPWRKNLGQIMSPETAFLLARSLRTLHIRVKTQCETALKIAEFLSSHENVLKVNYPGLVEFEGHQTAKKQMKYFGAMLSFIYNGSAKKTADMVDKLKIFTIAASLGGVESLVTQPITTTHFSMLPEERERRGIKDGMVRISCGLEDADDLIEDLEQAMK